MSNYRYILQKYSSLADRYTCPSCLEKKKFTRYIDTQTNQQLAYHVGRCERTDSCGYHYKPRDFFKENPDSKPTDFKQYAIVPAPAKLVTSYIDKSVVEKTLSNYDTNIFTQFLTSTFGEEVANKAIERYRIGTTSKGATVFYQIDLSGNIRSGKIMKYNLINSLNTSSGKDCKRNKNIKPNWVHKALQLKNFNLSHCLFGEHLLTDKIKSISLVESEKSAVICSIYQPQYIWLACGGKDGLSLAKIQALKDRNVILYPDLGGYSKWCEKAKEIGLIAKSVVVSKLLEGIATDDERASGLDIADFLLRYKPSNI